MILPDIPRLYTAPGRVVGLPALRAGAAPAVRQGGPAAAISTGALAVLGVFLHLTGDVPLGVVDPLHGGGGGHDVRLPLPLLRDPSPEAGYTCARAFILAEFAASLEWQIHCVLWPGRSPWAVPSLVLLAMVYSLVYSFAGWYDFRHRRPERGIGRSPGRALFSAVIMAAVAFAVSNLAFTQDGQATFTVFYIRTLVDLAGVLVLSLQQDQLREDWLHRELEAMDNVLHRQYEQ